MGDGTIGCIARVGHRPILFVVYISDLPEEMRSLFFLFANDMKLVNRSSKSENFSEDLHTAALWVAQRDMQFSWSKCKTMYFGRGQAPYLVVDDELARHDLEPLDAFKDLGVVLRPELQHHDQADAAVTKLRNAAFLLRWVFHHLPTPVFI